MGVTLAGLAEGMALADRAGLQQKDVMEVNQLTLTDQTTNQHLNSDGD